MTTYSVYGLALRSELPLPELFENDRSPDITLSLARLSVTGPDTNSVIYRPISPSGIYVFYKKVGIALVTSGSQIQLSPAPDVDPLTLRLFVLQQVLGVLLLQRGYFVLHASAAIVNGCAVAFAGPSGEGKSTIAAVLNARNFPVLTDDVLAVDTRPAAPLAYPGLLQLKLTEQTRSEVAGEIIAEQSIENRAKKLCAIRGAAVREPAPLDSIFLLLTGSTLEITPVPPAKAAIELVRQTYGSRLLHAIGLSAAHFEQCISLTRRVQIFNLSRPRDLSLLPQIADRIIERVRPSLPL